MKVYETELPGIGVRYTLKFDTDGELVVLTQNDGGRDVYWREGSKSDADHLFTLDEDDARKVSDIFDGTYFQPVEDGLEDVFENARIRWIHIAPESPLAGQTIGQAGIRSRTGVTILGIRRGGTILSEVDAETQIVAEDILVGVGSDEGHEALRAVLS